jgi:ribosomal protein L23
MPTKQSIVYLPEMAITLVRRVTAKLPYNHFLFRTDPKWTKLEIKEYFQKVYNVKCARITTSVQLG